MPGNPAFARLLANALTRQDRPASWLAGRLGVAPSTVTRWLDESTRPESPELVLRTADCLGVYDATDRARWLAAAGYAATPNPASVPYSAEPERWPGWLTNAAAVTPGWLAAPLLAQPAFYAAVPWHVANPFAPPGCGDQGINLGQQRLALSTLFGTYFAGLLERSGSYLSLSGQVAVPAPPGVADLTPLERMALALTYPRGPRLLVIAADAGMGKSTVAAQLVRCLLQQGDFDLLAGDSAKTRQVDVSSGAVQPAEPGSYDAASCFARLRQQLGLAPSSSLATADIADRLAGRRTLIVVDNLDTVANRDALLAPLGRLLSRDVRAVITTRTALALPALAQHCMVAHLHPLTLATLPGFLRWHRQRFAPTAPLAAVTDPTTADPSPQELARLLRCTGGVPLLVQLVYSSALRLSWAYLDWLPQVYGNELLDFLYGERWEELDTAGPEGRCARAVLRLLAANQEQGESTDLAALTAWAERTANRALLQPALALLAERFLLASGATEGSFALFPSLVEYLLRLPGQADDGG